MNDSTNALSVGSGNSDNGPKVRYTVRVPENLRFVAENVNGEVIAENLGRSVKVNSVKGSVRVSTKSWAEVSLVNGSLDAKMGRSDWPGKLKLETVNGSITVELPNESNVDVDFKSVSGNIGSSCCPFFRRKEARSSSRALVCVSKV